MFRAIPEPADPVGNTVLTILKCVTHVLAHPSPMSPVHTSHARERQRRHRSYYTL